MAAYSALVSLMNTIEQIQHNPRCPISLEKEQVESLREHINFLLDFLEGYSHVADDVESRIADAAYAAEDIIESCIADRILSRSIGVGKIINFIAQVRKVMEDMDSVKEEVMQLKENMGVHDQQLHKSSSISVGSLRSSSTGQNDTMVGFDDVLYEVMDKLIGGQPNRRIIPIVGMGGIGKTTLARNIYQNKVVVQHFDILVWVTISQEYKIREILLELVQEGAENLMQMNEYELRDKLHKKLSGRRYLIIMDDVWDIQVWDELKFFFPDNNNGSRVMLTTRLKNLASQVDDTHVIHMAFLDEDNSWNLFSKIVFEEKCCPDELVEMGKKIVKNCKGLPLSIVVIGGLLSKSKRTREYWESTLENLNSIVNLEENERGLQILYMSYNNMPIHLKSCFLYMGVFKEDSLISVTKLIRLWSAEGFLRPLDDRRLKEAAGVSTSHSSEEKRSLEEAAEEYLQELVDRNLILVERRNYNGKVKVCKIHDLLRDLCLKEAQKVKFLCVMGEQSTLNIPQHINTERRISIPKITTQTCDKYPPEVHFLSVARSLIWQHSLRDFPSFFSRLSRVYTGGYLTFEPVGEYSGEYYPQKDQKEYSGEFIFQQVNLRYIALRSTILRFSSSNLLLPLWNLQTLVLETYGVGFILEIWKMPQLKYVKVGYLRLSDPPADDNIVILDNLQVLAEIQDFKCGEEVVKRIPNIKKLKVKYSSETPDNHCINNLCHLNALESLNINFFFSVSHLLQNLTIPQNLKKLKLQGCDCNWEDIMEKIGSLPLLEKLRLHLGFFRGGKWETVEGQFPSLKFLEILWCENLKYWMTESSHFPRLQYLALSGLKMLKEIPSDIGEISTLQSILLRDYSKSAYKSAKRILNEQEEFGEVCLQLILEGVVFDTDEDENDDE